MLLPIILNGLALIALLLALAAFASMKLMHSKKRQIVAFSLLGAILFTLGAAFFNTGAYVQDRRGINLGLPAQAPTKAKLWVEQHKNEPPDAKQVARNIRIIQDGLTFYRQHADRFPPEAKAQFEEYSKLPPKIDHVLSFAEEQRYFRAAEGTMKLIGSLASGAPVPAPAP